MSQDVDIQPPAAPAAASVVQSGPTAVLSPVAALRAIRAILTDLELSPAQRVAAVLIVTQADNGTGTALASYRQVRQATGLSNETIAAAFSPAGPVIGRHLASAGHGANGSTRLRVIVPGATVGGAPGIQSAPSGGAQRPPSAPVGGAPQDEGATAGGAPGIQSAPLDGAPSGGQGAPVGGDILTEETTKRRNPQPPLPPTDAAKGGACASPPHTATQTESICGAVNKAHRAVFGVAMPKSWKKRIERMGEGAEVLATVTAADMRAAKARAKTHKREFGFGWLAPVMRDKAAAKMEGDKGGGQDANGQGGHQQADAAKLVEQQARAQQQAAFFATLMDEIRTAYRKKVQIGPFAPKRPEHIEAQAAALAFWNQGKKP